MLLRSTRRALSTRLDDANVSVGPERGLNVQYLLAMPSNTSIRDLEVEPPVGTGVGRPPQRPWQSVSAWTQAQPATALTEVDVRNGSKGLLPVTMLKRVHLLKQRVRTRNDQRQESPDDEMPIVNRDRQTVTKTDYDPSRRVEVRRSCTSPE